MAEGNVSGKSYAAVSNNANAPLWIRNWQPIEYAELEPLIRRNQIGEAVWQGQQRGLYDLELQNAHADQYLGQFIEGQPRGKAVTFLWENLVESQGVLNRPATLDAIAKNQVHEGLHGLGLRGSQEAEIQVRILTDEWAQGGPLSNTQISNIRQIVSMHPEYQVLPLRSNASLEIYPGWWIHF